MTSAVNQIIEVGFDDGWQYNFAILCTCVQFLNLPEPSHFFLPFEKAQCCFRTLNLAPWVFFCDVDKLLRCFSSWVFLPPRHHVALPGTAFRNKGRIRRRSKKVVSFDSVNLPSGKCCWKVWKFLESDRNKQLNSSKQIGSNIWIEATQTIITWRWWIFRFLSSDVWRILIDIAFSPRVGYEWYLFVALVKPWGSVWAVSTSGIVTGSNQP